MSVGRIPVIPTIVVLAAAATMVALGIWQLGRLEEKEALLARYAAAAGETGVLARFPDDPLDHLFRRTAFTCGEVREWNAIAGRNDVGRTGYVHIADCPVGDVVVGWSPGPDSVQWDGGAVTGMIAPGGDDGWRLVADPPLAGLDANASPNPNDLPNNHLAYAVQWFFFALTALVIYALALRKRWRSEG